MMRMRLKGLPWLLWIVLCSFLLVACSSDTAKNNNPSANSTKPAEQTVDPGKTPGSGNAGSKQVVVYFPTRDAMFLMPETRKVSNGQDPVRASMEMLIAGPESRELEAIVPQGTALRSITVKDHVAYVDFSNAIIKKNPGGATTELLLVGAIANTLTEFPDISGVRILVEGKQVETLTGHADLTGVLGRSEEMIKKHK
ncbi:MAG: Lipoprotein LpqB, GerMN protein [Firmicutes bacterium]|nr:Lipoprotein LpqB, GerMN protein [Bacillota bacterium]